MSEQDPKFTDEMVSAYLDGELSDSEREQVERIVEGDPQYRRMLEELHALRDSLKSLPRFQLDGAFHQRVLERAVEQTRPSPAKATETDERHVWRRLAWVGGALAASVLLMFFLPGVFNTLDTGRFDEIGQAPGGVEKKGENPFLSSQGVVSDQQPPATNSAQADVSRAEMTADDSRADDSRADDLNADDLTLEPLRESRRQVVPPRRAEGLEAPVASSPPSPSAPFGVGDASGGAASEAGFAEGTLADDAAATLSEFESDVDAIVYCAKVAKGTTSTLALRGLYRASGEIDEPGSRPPARDVAFESTAQPRFFLVEGSPEQIALSLSRIESTDLPGPANELTVNEPLAEKLENEGLGRGRGASPSDRYSKQDNQDRLRRSGRLYIDLDAADSEPAVVSPVVKDSDDYQRLLGFLAAESPRGLAELDAPGGVPPDVTASQPESASNLARRAWSPRNRDRVAQSKASPAPTATRLPETVRSQEQDESQIRVYSFTPNFGRKSSTFHYKQATSSGTALDPGAIAKELKSISPKNEEGTLRVLLVLPSAEGAADPVAQPAVSNPADPEPAEDAR